MKPLIEPRDYCNEEGFRREIDSIFMTRWIFACSLDGLRNHLDYRCIEIGGVSVIMQNFDGEIRAFNNVCSHRFARIHADAAGNRELKCPYHGWIYNSEGLPYAIPHKPCIREITPATLPDYRLSRWHVRTLGPLVFIKKEDGTNLPEDDLEQQFGEYASTLKDMAAACGELVENTEHIVKANWKLVVENTLEGYHVDCVHPNTIRKLGMAALAKKQPEENRTTAAVLEEEATNSRFTFAGQNSAVFSPLDAAVTERMDRTYKFLASRPQKLAGYRHFYFFPGFVFASTRGESFSIQRILPVNETTTQLTSFLFATSGLGELTKMEAALRKQFYASAAEFVQAIFLEDAAICEQVQRSIGFAHGVGVLSDEEERICAFHRAYRAALEDLT